MKNTTYSIAFLLLIASFPVRAVNVPSSMEFQQTVIDYQKSPSNETATKVIKLAAMLDKMPPIEDKNLFVEASSQLRDDFLKTNATDIEGLIEGCDHFKLDDLKQKYLELQKTVGKPSVTPASAATSK